MYPVLIEVKDVQDKSKIIPKVSIKKEYKPSTNTVLVTASINTEFKPTKVSWILSADKKRYTFEFGANTTYSTTFTDIKGNVFPVQINVTEVKNNITVTPGIKVEKTYNQATNKVLITVTSNIEFKPTKVSWNLSADKKKYTLEFGANTTYFTTFTDINDNVFPVEINVTEVKDNITVTPGIKVEKTYNKATNKVLITVTSNIEFRPTKVSWNLSADKKKYTLEFNANTTYITNFTDIKGNNFLVEINVTEVKDNIAVTPGIKVEKTYNKATNKVLVTVTSNIEFNPTKVSWTLSADKKKYTFEFSDNTTYSTTFTDIKGNVFPVQINITEVKKAKLTIKKEHNVAKNTVVVKIVSDIEFKPTKVTWSLSADKKQYTFEFTGNTTYSTTFVDIYDNVIPVEIRVTEVDDKGPVITVEYIHNADQTITAIMHSNEVLAATKPTWTLSADKLSYSKTFSDEINYTTPVEDIYGNQTIVSIIISRSNFNGVNESKYPGYKAALQQLQNKHPNWTIKLVYTGLDWNDVLNHENSLDSRGSPYSLTQETGRWRSSTDYNTYEGGWYRASKEAIAYMVDPRNSLDQYYVFQFQNLSSTSGTYSEIESMIRGTYLANNFNKTSIINSILNASRNYNVSSYHLASRMIQEQTNGWCANGYIYNGRPVYNFANIGATGKTDAEIKENGAKYAEKNHWFTPEACIDGTAAFLNNSYLKNGQITQYFQKYNVITSRPYTNQYMQNIRAANDEGYRTAKSYEKNGLLNLSFEFLIPVYENMPSKPAPRPST